MRVVALASLLGLLVGCSTGPVAFQLDVRGPSSAQATVRALGATTDAAPKSCATPCALEFVPDTAYEIELHAPGYKRARLPISYQTLLQYKLAEGEEGLVLRIPMQETETMRDQK